MANSSFITKFLIVCFLFGVAQYLVFFFGNRPELGKVPGFHKTDGRDENVMPQLRLSVTSPEERPHELTLELGQQTEQEADLGSVRKESFGNITTTRITQRREAEENNSASNTTFVLKDLRQEISKAKKFRFDGSWNSSFVSPKYHKHYDVNCSAIVHGDRRAVAAANELMKKKGGDAPIPSDEVVRSWTEDCKIFRSERHYPTNPQSTEEEQYPVAFILVTHKESSQVERLLRAIYQPQNVYCIHPDAKSSPAYRAAIEGLASCFENVFIASKIESVQYAGFTRLQADVNCMSDLLHHPIQWHYVLNLCGQDFPLKTNLEIVHQMQANNGKNDISGVIPPPYIRGRTRAHYTIINGKVTATRLKKSPPPHNLTIHFGNAYYAASRQFTDYVINNKVAIDLLHWSEDTFSPDEHYWGTLNRAPGVPGGYTHPTWDANVRFMKWGDLPKHPACQGKYVRALCVFGVGYLNYLSKMTHLFANKFYYSFDPVILQCIEELLDFRTAHPDTIADFVPNFPLLDMEWQLND